jgi:hypothetical protein
MTYSMGLTTLLGATHAPLDHCFIFIIFLEFFKTPFLKILKYYEFF